MWLVATIVLGEGGKGAELDVKGEGLFLVVPGNSGREVGTLLYCRLFSGGGGGGLKGPGFGT